MKTLLARIAKKALATGQLDGADVDRLIAYSNRHPMWRATASDKMIAAFDVIVTQGRKAA